MVLSILFRAEQVHYLHFQTKSMTKNGNVGAARQNSE